MKLKPYVQKVLERIALFLMMLLTSIVDFEVNVASILAIAVMMGTLVAVIRILEKYGVYEDEGIEQE